MISFPTLVVQQMHFLKQDRTLYLFHYTKNYREYYKKRMKFNVTKSRPLFYNKIFYSTLFSVPLFNIDNGLKLDTALLEVVESRTILYS